ncbi:MAG: hypothetical protein LUH07_08450 [Lachnospiraceae bacterium]|nr:hypothetical protein [Lachnospiraceae bacterium]
MNYEYQIADIRMLLHLPFSISVQQSSEAFLSSSAGDNADMHYVCRMVECLPEPLNTGHEENNRCYVETQDERQVFFRPSPTGTPYACVTWRAAEPDTLRCEYLPGQDFRLNYSMAVCDTLGIESVLLRYGGLLLHSSFIRWHNRGILFSGYSGIGKSTQADLWVNYQGAEILNGDRAGLRKADGIWTAYGLPYAGSSKVYRNESAPITAIFMLEQAPVNELHRLSPAKAILRLYPQIMIHGWDADFVQKALSLIEDLVGSVPVYLLRCRPDEEAVEIVKNKI